jgi:O-antigen ligase
VNEPLLPPDPLERAACLGLLGFAAATQVSIAATGILLTVTGLLWLAVVVRNRERIEVPAMFFPLALYAVLTLVAAAFSQKPQISLIDSKQLVVLLVVPMAYRLLPGRLSLTAVDVVITVGAVSAMLGIIQYVLQGYDNLGRRPQGMLGLNMTYSGLVMLVVCAAFARIMFATHNRTWAALVMPALLIALAFTFTRSAWIGACCGVGLLFVLRDFRLLALLPVALGVFILAAPPNLSARIYSTFSLTDPSNADRVAMMKSGVRMIKDHPLTGVGPDMILEVYPQ